jgi:hypothetical protein
MPTRPRLTTTYTVSTLELSPPAYEEIAAKLRAADYAHVFEDDQPGAMMDMTGIGITREPTLICKSCVQEYSLATPHVCPGLQPKDAPLARVSYVTQEKKAGGVFAVTIGFFDADTAREFHAWAAARASKADTSKAQLSTLNLTFMECESCRQKPGSPVLCESCQHNRAMIERATMALVKS